MILQLDTENADRDLSSLVTVLTHTPSATEPIWCKGLVMFGDGTKNLDGTGGDFELTITVGGNTIQPDPQTIAFSTAARAGVWTTEFPVPANAEVVLKAKSPNAGDSDVDVTAYLYQIDKVDVLAIGGDKQSATDLKDFADSGYDPATHKVEGVTVTDTTTTNTDMVAAAPTAAQNRAEMDSNSTKLAAIAVDVAGLDGEAMRGTDGAYTGGNITGNLSGSVGSVTGAVGSVTGDVGGNVTGSVGSVVADVDANLVSVEAAAEADNGVGWLAWFKRMLSIKDGNSDVEVVGANHVVTFKDRAGNPETVHTVVTATGARTRS